MTVINPKGLKQQVYYNHVKVRPGYPVFPTGQVAWDENGDVVGDGDIEAQVAQVYKNLGLLLEGLGATPDDIVKTTTYVTDPAYVSAIHAARQKFFAGVELPASTLFYVKALADERLFLEVEPVVMVSK